MVDRKKVDIYNKSLVPIFEPISKALPYHSHFTTRLGAHPTLWLIIMNYNPNWANMV